MRYFIVTSHHHEPLLELPPPPHQGGLSGPGARHPQDVRLQAGQQRLRSLNKHKEAVENFMKALELEPDNESYKSNLQIPGMFPGIGGPGGMDLGNFLNNPALMNMATTMMADPNMQIFYVDNIKTPFATSSASPVIPNIISG